MTFRRIRDLREDHDYTQQQLADQLYMPRNVYRRYEVGERDVPIWVLLQLADIYHTSTDYILGRTDRRDPIE